MTEDPVYSLELGYEIPEFVLLKSIIKVLKA